MSEFVCIAIAHLLRDSGARFRLGPSDRVFSGQANEDAPHVAGDTSTHLQHSGDPSSLHAAENIPVIAGNSLPAGQTWTVLDTVVASSMLKAEVVEFTKTPEFDDMIEGLKKELRFKAFHRGATAILQFTVQLSPLAVPTQYRLIASGIAIRHK